MMGRLPGDVPNWVLQYLAAGHRSTSADWKSACNDVQFLACWQRQSRNREDFETDSK